MRLARPVRGWSAPRISSNPSRWFSTMLTTRASAAGFPALKSSIRRLEDTCEYSLLFAPHPRRRSRRAGRMVVAEHVQSAVDDKPQQLLSGADALAPGVVASDLDANIYVADYGSAPSDPFQAERNHVCRTLMTKVAMIQARDGGASDESDRQHRFIHTLRAQGSGGRVPNEGARDVESPHSGRDVNRET